MKFFVYLFAAFWAVYLMFFGITIGQIDNINYEIFDILDGGMIFAMALDFLTRLTMQETPAQRTKPYKLLPVKQQSIIDVFLIRLAYSPLNWFWLFFWVPFSFFTVLHFYGFTGFVAYNLGWVLLYVLNGHWFLFWRTIASTNALFYVIPIAIYASLAYFGIFADFAGQWLFDACIWLGREFCNVHLLGFMIVLLLIGVMFYINRRHQFYSIYHEISKNESISNVKSSEMPWLNKFGIIGEYLKLEVKSQKRNKTVKKAFLSGLMCVIIFSILFAFTDVYDNSMFMESFICVYCFACLGTITLTSILCAEGNYMDFLQTRKESLLYLLKSKYYYNCALLLIPFLFALMPVFKGKFLLVEILGCMFFVAGCVFPFLFQQAVYNKRSMPLNVQIIKQGNNSKSQFVVSLVALFVPMIVMTVLNTLFSKHSSAVIMMVLGLLGVVTHDLWLRNIYKRFMKRRYVNLEGYRNTK